MEEKWEECLRMIREKVKNERVYNVWFGDVRLESYDEQSNAVVLNVPSPYVYEYLEMYCIRLLQGVLTSVFGAGVNLGYHVAGQVDYGSPAQRQQLGVAGARKALEDGLRSYLGDRMQWLPAYDQVADWLSDNKGRGLLCVGNTGLGKTILCARIIPALLGCKAASVTALEMNSRIDELLKERCVIIDDLGREPVETRTYGNRRTPFFELCDAAERDGKLLIITTNLSTTPDDRYPDSIEHRYGASVISRLRAVTSVVLFEGTDLRC